MSARIRSESSEGIYYLVNGWNKYKAFWYKDADIEKHPYLKERILFKDSSSAKRSLTKLLKIMDDYREDNFVIEIFD